MGTKNQDNDVQPLKPLRRKNEKIISLKVPLNTKLEICTIRSD